MATRDREWPDYTVWYCCPTCGRLWTFQGSDIVGLDPHFALGPAQAGEGITNRPCAICEGTKNAPAAEI